MLDDLEIVIVVDSNEHDWQVAGYSQRPQGRRPQDVLAEYLAGCTQRRICVQHAIGDALELLRDIEIDSQVAQLNLCLRPGQCLRPVERRCVAVFVGERQRVGSAQSHDGPEGDTYRFSPGNPHPTAQCQYRIEHRTGRVRERPRVHD